MTDREHPKVFVSHASEDKDRFARPFALRLRGEGIDAWFDEWEIAPGHSLVDKIFEEGLKNASAVIIVLSNTSVSKPWVREELNTSVVNRITRQTRIIPVIIDDCEVPESLRSILYVKIDDLSNYDAAFRRVVNAIYEVSEKPPLGPTPRHVQSQVEKMPGLSAHDTNVLRAACEASLKTDTRYIQGEPFISAVHDLGLTDDEVIESLDILENRLLVDIKHTFDDHIPSFVITIHGFENYAKFFIPNSRELMHNTMLAIMNENALSSGDIVKHLNIGITLVEYMLDMLEARKYVKLSKFAGGIDGGGSVRVREVTALGRRFAEQLG